MALVLGYDIGTSAVKVTACDEQGVVQAVASVPHTLDQREVQGAMWSEQRPESWWEGVCAATRRVLSTLAGSRVVAIGLCGQMHGSVLMGRDAAQGDANAQPLGPAILWNDQRTQRECEEIRAEVGGDAGMVRLTGLAVREGFTLPKLMWVRRNQPRVWAQVQRVLLPKDFIAFRLCGELVTDVGDASGTMLFDVRRREWSRVACDRFLIDRQLLPRAVESASVVGQLSARAAAEMGVSLTDGGVAVIIGTGDNQAGAVGEGVVEAGSGLCIIGTSGVIVGAINGAKFDEVGATPGRLQTVCAAAGPTSWCMTGCTLSAGLALRWARDLLAPGMGYEEVMAMAAEVEPGCEGLLFFPYLAGERCPHAQPQARGAWIGLGAQHSRGHLLRAVIEGVTFTLGQIVGLMRGSGVPLTTLCACGGGNRSAFWRQLQADVFGIKLVQSAARDATGAQVERGGAYGAAMLAAVGCGWFSSVAEASRAWIGKAGERGVSVEPGAKCDERLAVAAATHAMLAARHEGLWSSAIVSERGEGRAR